jgi:hypothetical protein
VAAVVSVVDVGIAAVVSAALVLAAALVASLAVAGADLAAFAGLAFAFFALALTSTLAAPCASACDPPNRLRHSSAYESVCKVGRYRRPTNAQRGHDMLLHR